MLSNFSHGFPPGFSVPIFRKTPGGTGPGVPLPAVTALKNGVWGNIWL